MYKLFSDRQELFEAKLKIAGAKFENTSCRIIVESNDWNLVFNGSITKDGNCTVPIKKLKSILPSGTEGQMRLEVVAEDTLFVPWESEFKIEESKSVKVEVKSQGSDSVIQESKPKISISVKKESANVSDADLIKELQKQNKRTQLRNLVTILKEENIGYKNFTSKKAKKIINAQLSDTPKDIKGWIVKGALSYFKNK